MIPGIGVGIFQPSSRGGKYLLVSEQESGYVNSSDNYGLTWNRQLLGGSYYGKRVAMSDDGKYRYVAGSSLSVSTDFGATWSTTSPTTNGIVGLSCDPTGRYVIVSASGEAFKLSDNFGVSFSSKLDAFQVGSTAFALSAAGIFYAGVLGVGLYKSTNYGATWTLVYSTGNNYHRIACSADGKYITATRINSYSVIKSSDYGATWNTGPSSGSSGNNSVVAMSEGGQFQLTGGPLSNLFLSTDSGNTFNIIDAGYKSYYGAAVVRDGSIMFQSNHLSGVISLLKSTDYGVNWVQVSGISNPFDIAISR